MTVALKVPQPKVLKSSKTSVAQLAQMEEYERLASQLGVKGGDGLKLRRFEAYLEKAGIAVYPLDKVVPYMDGKSAEEGAKHGWLWRPVRAQDRKDVTAFGKAAKVGRRRYYPIKWDRHFEKIVRQGYWGPVSNGSKASDHFGYRNKVYDHQIPLHALQKIAKIEADVPEINVCFMISDYAPKPTPARPKPLPDPFLMAVIPNPSLKDGVGRYVIDFWDEPGFGLMKQLGL